MSQITNALRTRVVTLRALLALAAGLSGGAADPTILRRRSGRDASPTRRTPRRCRSGISTFVYDTIENSFYWPGDRTPDVRAQNVNTVDEVPDSNWFTNRIGTRADHRGRAAREGQTPSTGRRRATGRSSPPRTTA